MAVEGMRRDEVHDDDRQVEQREQKNGLAELVNEQRAVPPMAPRSAAIAMGTPALAPKMPNTAAMSSTGARAPRSTLTAVRRPRGPWGFRSSTMVLYPQRPSRG